MTSEQIAELRKLHDGIIAQAGPWGGRESVSIPIENWRFLVACNNHLPRLIDEREALLKALKSLLYTIVLREEDSAITGPAMGAAHAAIEKAEAP